MTFRKTTSLTTLLAFILLLITSIILYVTPQGKIAFWANWKILGLGKEQWGALHTNLGFLFIIAGLLHTILNWGPIMAYMKNKAKQLKVFTIDFNVALIITLIITVFTLFEIPPINAVQEFNHSLKEAAAEEYGEPPYGHAEASSLKSFCQRTGLKLKDSIRALEKADLTAVSEKATLAEIAAANGITPQQVYVTMKPAPVAGQAKEMAESPGMGFGRKTMTEVCEKYGLDTTAIVKSLSGLGIKATAESTMKEIAAENDMADPHALYEAIRQVK
jgi:transposase-like protein